MKRPCGANTSSSAGTRFFGLKPKITACVASPAVCVCCLLICAAFYGWERIGQIITPLATTTTAGDNAGAAASAEQCRETENCPVASSTPTKWVLVGHSLGVGAIELVS